MKWMLLFLSLSLFVVTTHAQNIGIGTSSPSEKLEVNGGIKIGNSTNAAKGTMRWNEIKNDFEGYNGTAWLSLTGGKSGWGNQENYIMEDEATDFLLHNGATGYGNYLGSALAIHNNILLAGAMGDYNIPDGIPGAGSVRMFVKENGKWPLTPTLSIAPQSPLAYENFGASLAINNSNIIIGAKGYSTNKGKVYIYTINSSGQPVYKGGFSHMELLSGDGLGNTVAIAGNYAMSGAPARNVNGNISQGKVYILRYNNINDSWGILGGGLTAPDGAGGDFFGETISMSGDYAVIGAPLKTTGNVSHAGKVYIYRYDGAGWIYSSSITLPNPVINDRFGSSVFLKEDTLVVGATEWNGFNDNQSTGKVFVYIRNGNNWILHSTLTPSDGKKGDGFGNSVHLSNGKIIAGAEYAQYGTTGFVGKAYLFSLENNEWKQQAILKASVPDNDNMFGKQVILDQNCAIASETESTVISNADNGRLYFYYKK